MAPVQPLNLAEPARLSEAQTLNHAALAPETLTALTQGLSRLVKSGENDMRLQLQPAELGRIELQITHHADGLRVTMVAEVASTAGLLDQHLADLRQSLAQAGINLSGLSVGSGSAQQPSQGGPGGQGAGHQPAFPGSGLLPGLNPVLAAARPGEPAGLVDYWI